LADNQYQSVIISGLAVLGLQEQVGQSRGLYPEVVSRHQVGPVDGHRDRIPDPSAEHCEECWTGDEPGRRRREYAEPREVGSRDDPEVHDVDE
jgi:hypothetical protein